VLQGGGYAVGPAIGAALNQVSFQHHIEYAWYKPIKPCCNVIFFKLCQPFSLYRAFLAVWTSIYISAIKIPKNKFIIYV